MAVNVFKLFVQKLHIDCEKMLYSLRQIVYEWRQHMPIHVVMATSEYIVNKRRMLLTPFELSIFRNLDKLTTTTAKESDV